MRAEAHKYGVQYHHKELTAWRKLLRSVSKDHSGAAEATSKRDGKVYHLII